MEIGILKNWNENCSAVLLTFVLFFLLVLLKLQGEPITTSPELINSSQKEMASTVK
tara:strand:+ start:45748 stop:45915 length:168 start_codon:yes stop_codon:yes gene_type:complete